MADVAKLTASMVLNTQGFEQGVDRANRKLNAMTGAFSSTQKKLESMFSPDAILSGFVGGMAAGVTSKVVDALTMPFKLAADKAGEFLSKGIAKSMDMEQTGISLEVMMGDAKKAAAMMSDLNKLTGRMGGIDQFGAAQSLMGFGVDSARIIPVMQQIGNIAGGNAEKFGRIALQYGQVMSKGKLLAEDLNIIAESGVNLRGVLADQLGVSVADLAKLMEKGMVSASDFAKAMETLSNTKFKGMLERQSETMKGLSARFEKAGEEAGKQFAEGFIRGFGIDPKSQLSSFVRTAEIANRKGAGEKIAAGAGSLYDQFLSLTPLGQAFRGSLKGGSSAMDAAARLDRQRQERADRQAARDAAIKDDQDRQRRLIEGSGPAMNAIGRLISGDFNAITSAMGGISKVAMRGVNDLLFADPRKPDRMRPDLRHETGALVSGSSEAMNAMIRAKWGPKDDAEKAKKEATDRNTKALHDLTETVKKGAQENLKTVTSFFGGGG